MEKPSAENEGLFYKINSRIIQALEIGGTAKPLLHHPAIKSDM